MTGRKLHRVSSGVVVGLSLLAMLTVVIGTRGTPQPDEGTGAHIFQLAIVLLAPTMLLFLATADWTRPLRSLRPLMLGMVLLLIAFVRLYRFEHHG